MADITRRSSSTELESMRELDPSPIDTPPAAFPSPSIPSNIEENSARERDEKDSSIFSPSSISSRLGLNKHPLTTTLQFLQKYSTYPFTLFLGLHITNTSLLPLILSLGNNSSTTDALHTSDTLLLLTRPYYQSPWLEPLLILAPLATHILSGVGLRLHRRQLNLHRHGAESRTHRRLVAWPRLSTQSKLGYTLVPLLTGHAVVNRFWPWWLEGGSSGVGLRYVAHGFAKHPLIANLGYLALVAVASWHVVGGAAKWLKVSPEYVSDGGGVGAEYGGMAGQNYSAKMRRKRWWMVNGASATMAAIWMLGGLGVVGRAGKALGARWEVSAWDEIYRTVPIFGAWL